LETARKEAAAANEARSSFLANMSHVLRMPLNADIGYSKMMAEEAPEIGAESLVPDLQKVQVAAKRGLGLINDILDLSKIETGRVILFVEEFMWRNWCAKSKRCCSSQLGFPLAKSVSSLQCSNSFA